MKLRKMANNTSLYLEIVSPQGRIFEGDVDSVSLPAVNGTITILPNHVSLFTKLEEGEIEIHQGNKTLSVIVAGGFLEINKNKAHILSDYAVRAESIQIAKSEERKRQAEQKLKEKVSNEDFVIIDKDLKMSILELKVADKIKRKQRT